MTATSTVTCIFKIGSVDVSDYVACLIHIYKIAFGLLVSLKAQRPFIHEFIWGNDKQFHSHDVGNYGATRDWIKASVLQKMAVGQLALSKVGYALILINYKIKTSTRKRTVFT
jgi:hypothetical protein